jgi:hypothetical protein
LPARSEPTAQRFASHAVDAPELIEIEDKGTADEDD